MATVKNVGNQVRGFYTDDGNQVTVKPGEEKEFNMTEADFAKAKELAKAEDPPTLEISGSHGGVKPKTPQEQREADAKKREADAKKQAADDKADAKEAAKEKK